MTRTQRNPEQDQRLAILNTLLTTPHRRLDETYPVHAELVRQDPRFYVRLAAWYQDHGDVRDHKESFVITLVTSAFEGHRDVGLAMLREMPPYQVARVVDFIHGRKQTRTVAVPQSRPQNRAARRAARADRRTARDNRRVGVVSRLVNAVTGRGRGGQQTQSQAAPARQTRTETLEYGLFRNVPRSLKTEVARYLREREADPQWFDSTALVARKSLKRLYAVLHVAPGERAQQILFDRDPPRDSRLYALRELAAARTPANQAAAIVQHRIPYRVASTVVRQMTPAVLLALINAMTPQELINNLASLRRRGALDNPDLKGLVDAKLAEARTDRRVSALKAEEAIAASGASGELRQQLEKVADTQVKAKGRIQRPTALLIDKSSSMNLAIELGKRIGALISAVSDDDLFVYAFDTIAYPIEAAGPDLADWERALAGINASGCTSCGVGVEALRRKKQLVEQIVLVTDEGENTSPPLVTALKQYREELGAEPNVCIVRTPGGSNQLETACRRSGVSVDVFQFAGDYYALPNLVPLLARPSKLELLMEILEYPLPQRRAA